jgi:hypothetical protein
MDNSVIFISSRVSNLNVLLAPLFKIRMYRFGFAGLNINKSNIQTIFTKQLLLVFNVGKNKIACFILTFICNISNSINTKLSKILRNDKITFCIIAN